MDSRGIVLYISLKVPLRFCFVSIAGIEKSVVVALGEQKDSDS